MTVTDVDQRGRSQKFARGEGKTGGLGDGSPPVGSRGRAPVGVWGQGEAPRSWRHILNNRENKQKYTTQRKLTQLLTLLL